MIIVVLVRLPLPSFGPLGLFFVVVFVAWFATFWVW
jgi:hypothetical protein